MSRSLPTFVLAALILALDQLTKWLAVACLTLKPGHSVEIIPGFFSLTLIHNTGAAWGMFKDHGARLALLAFGALAILLITRRHFTYRGPLPRICLGLLIGGIAGNLMDRLNYEHVIDFLNFYIARFDMHWPAFNVADSAICIGVGLYLIDSFMQKTEPEKLSCIS